MTAGSHKQDRYIMPIFLVFDILAAMGWVYAWERLSERWHQLNVGVGHGLLLQLAGGAIRERAAVSSLLFPYFNPWLAVDKLEPEHCASVGRGDGPGG